MSGGHQRPLLLVVEGVDDVRRYVRLLPGLRPPPSILDANGSQGVRLTCRALSTGSDRPYLGVCDRDLLSDDQVEELRQSVPGLFILPTRCLENELLHPPLLSRALDQSGHQATESEVRSLLRTIADEQYDDIHAAMVEGLLYRADEERVRREPGESGARAPETSIGGQTIRVAGQTCGRHRRVDSGREGAPEPLGS